MNHSEFDLQSMKEHAKSACAHAHAPYSRFYVGSAVMDRNGNVHTGCNVENASYGLTLCAERNAISSAVAAGMKAAELEAVVIYTPGRKPASPCGACRQVMQEFMHPHTRVYSCCDTENTLEWTVVQLLPAPFQLEPSKHRS